MSALSLRQQRGAAVVEFAVLAVLLVVFVFGIIEFGLIWVQSHYLANAAREGARVAAKADNAAARVTAGTNAAKEYLREFFLYGDKVDDGEFLVISVNDTGTLPNSPISPAPPVVTVTVTVQSAKIWQPVLWKLLNLMPGTDFPDDFLTTLTQSAVFVIEPE